MKPIYFDHNASTPLIPEVIAEMTPYLQSGFGNPSSSHSFGQESKRAIESARMQVANLLNCQSEEIVFTSGGTESNNFAIRGVLENHANGHIITSSIEHPAVLEVCRYLEKHGSSVTYLPVDSDGLVNPDDLRKAIRPDTILISIMLANNEVGTIQPIQTLAGIAHELGIPFHTDAAQAVGKIHVDVAELGVNLLSVAGHKMNAPKGVGALFIKTGTRLSPLLLGAGHERGLRAGTENVLEIVGLGIAAENFRNNETTIIQNLRRLRDEFIAEIQNELPDVRFNGSIENCLPNTANLWFPGIDTNTLLSELPNVAASAGAACHANDVEPSHVLKAMGFPTERILSSVRFSIGRTTTESEVQQAAQLICETVQKLTGMPDFPEPSKNVPTVRLTQFTHGLGCACKIRPQSLEKILKNLKPTLTAQAQVGFESFDDAAVYRINDSTSIVSTVDFFTPVVDDPFDFGRIAAANSLSDIYAMGAKPLFALNIVAFPEKRLPLDVLEQILRGAQSIADEVGIPILGGHTIEDNEPKFGWAVNGIAHPDRIIRNIGAKTGDALVLTKPIGVGILSTALKRGLIDTLETETLVRIMSTLNAKSAEIMSKFPIHACTDITGFGLLGHLHEMTSGSHVTARIFSSQVPVISRTMEMIRRDVIPGGTDANRQFAEHFVEWDDRVSQSVRILLCDAQTSGGLLVALSKKIADELVKELHDGEVETASVIGVIETGEDGKILVAP
ncbi:MAG: selenide, water dikinase SelD [Candidatus Marinimicrobia bacterium CG08_land_8_20_14_0_20_45_22]|nr:MAG: selenide, water dikinase SelD [Candidatus Marinimicrobia bacterium CG08_land_8_20_14_0_20_45_22]